MSISDSMESKKLSEDENYKIEQEYLTNKKKLNFESESDHSVLNFVANSMNSITKKKTSILNNYEFFVNNMNKNFQNEDNLKNKYFYKIWTLKECCEIFCDCVVILQY